MNEIIKDTNAEYHGKGKEVISASGLKMIYKKSVKHYLESAGVTETDSMRLGTAVHARILEPQLFDSEVAVLPEMNLRTKDGRLERDQFVEKNKGKTVIRQDDMHTVECIYQNFKYHHLAPDLIQGNIEFSHYGVQDGIEIRCRPDVYNPETKIIADVKTCQDNSPRAFKSDVYKYAYHLQAVFYCGALHNITGEYYSPLNFRFIAVETNPPYSCEVYALSEEMIESGFKAMRKAWSEWQMYKETGIALGYQTDDLAADGSLIL